MKHFLLFSLMICSLTSAYADEKRCKIVFKGEAPVSLIDFIIGTGNHPVIANTGLRVLDADFGIKSERAPIASDVKDHFGETLVTEYDYTSKIYKNGSVVLSEGPHKNRKEHLDSIRVMFKEMGCK